MSHANISLMTAVVVMMIVFLLGYARAVMVRANKDYKNTKAAVKPLRKAFWSSTWTVIKIGFGMLVLLGILVTWNVRDYRDGDRDTPLVPAKATPAPSRR